MDWGRISYPDAAFDRALLSVKPLLPHFYGMYMPKIPFISSGTMESHQGCSGKSMENIGKAVLAICINLGKPNFFLGSLKKYKNPFSLPMKMKVKVVSNSGRDLKWLFQVK